MNNGIKLILYAILVTAVTVTGILFFKNFGKLFEDTSSKAKIEAAAEPDPTATTTPADTNVVTATNAVALTNAVADTNAVAAVTNSLTDTNATSEAAVTNAPPETNTVATTKPPSKKAKSKKAATAGANGQPQGHSRIGLWTGSFILSVIALGALIAWDISNFMGSRALKVLYNDDGGGQKDPEYEEAEKIWANGQHLEAVRLMREYYNKNPREVHVALRIAEIYEKDLNNFLAAALEYEEVLTKKLPAERWGWAAIHLCNLYFKLGQEMKGYALLQRIVKEYGNTQAAEKARKRLKEVDPNLLAEAEPPTPAAPEAAPEPEEPKSNLPPGFRPKK
jgi:tetratricopeptide (TPR) repeat protein